MAVVQSPDSYIQEGKWEGNLEQLKGLVSERAFTGETMLLNMGPHHPSTHGVLRVLLELDGEQIVSAVPDIGYLHTGIEKNIEAKTYEKGVTLTDRMDYLSPLSNNMAFCMAIEKLADIDVPERAQLIRVMVLELQRIASHLVWLGTHAIDLGAMSVLLYCFREREKVLDMLEMLSGQRMMGSYIRPGGVWRDITPDFKPALRKFLDEFPRSINDYQALLEKNPLWIDRTQGVGVVEPEVALAWCMTGPSLRGSGVNWDIRKAEPYSSYETFDFNVPLGEHGDVYDRFMCRILEMWESVKILEQGISACRIKGRSGLIIASMSRRRAANWAAAWRPLSTTSSCGQKVSLCRMKRCTWASKAHVVKSAATCMEPGGRNHAGCISRPRR
jgi:NADH-quinone oxidoreductase subunit D